MSVGLNNVVSSIEMKAIPSLIIFLTATLIGGCKTSHPRSDSVPVKNGIAHLVSWGGGILVDVPKQYKVVKSQGPDFDVFTIRSTTDPDCWLGVYIGHHPMREHVRDRQLQTIQATVGGKQCNWFRQYEPPPTEFGPYRHDLYIAHLFDDHPQESARHVIVHVWARGTLSTFAEVKGITETIRLAPQGTDKVVNRMP